MQDEPYYLRYLKQDYESRGKDGAYSLRCYARYLDVNVATLSRLFARKTVLSAKTAARMADRLHLSPKESPRFIASALEERYERQVHDLCPPLPGQDADVRLLENDRFEIISNWYHYGILSLCNVKGFVLTPSAAARRLNITRVEADYAFARLERLGLIRKEGDRYVRYQETHLRTSDPRQTTEALKNHQMQILKGAQRALVRRPITERIQQSGTMAINPAKLDTARKMVQDFMMNLCQYLEDESATEVYNLGVSLYPAADAGTD